MKICFVVKYFIFFKELTKIIVCKIKLDINEILPSTFTIILFSIENIKVVVFFCDLISEKNLKICKFLFYSHIFH